MKYLIKALLIVLAILFLLKIVIHIFDKGHEINYSIGNFNIKEKLTVNKGNNYYFEIKKEKFKINFQIFENYNKSSKIINNIEYYKDGEYQCIMPIFKNKKLLTDIMCIKENNITYYHDMNNPNIDAFATKLKKYGYQKEDYLDRTNSKKLSNTQALYEENIIPNHYLAIENYKGITLINNVIKSVKLFENDIYKKPVSIFTDKYYIVADYNEEYTFKKFYVVNLINGNIKEIRSYNEISFDSIIEGVVDKNIYLFDKDAEVQYKINIEDESIEKNNEIKYFNGKWNTISSKEVLSGKKFDNYYSNEISGYDKVNKVGNYYYLYKKEENNYLVYRADIQNKDITTYLFTTTDPDSIIYQKDYIYFKKGSTVYYYSKYGIRKLIENSELEFNEDLSFGVYAK